MEADPEKTLYLLKPGELALKGGNKKSFETALQRNLALLVRGTGAQASRTNGRFYLRCSREAEGRVEDALGRLFGITGWAKARIAAKTVEAVTAACVEEGRLLAGGGPGGITTFKIEARRTDKSFPLDSYGICCRAGEAVMAAVPGLRVDVHHPEARINVEIREKAFIYGRERPGLRGLPVGTAGRGLLLLSGGIDSPVAGYMMASRGMGLDAVYFHAYPYTSEEARRKTERLADLLGTYTLGLRLFVVNFTPVELRIKERSPEPWRTVLLRMAMMDCARLVARSRGAKCLVTGESLSQVASQTVENITCTQSRAAPLPVLRPLIGMDKEDIVRLSEKIGAYRISILPYEDCCVLFSPPHPVLRGSLAEAAGLYEALDCASLLEEAARTSEIHKVLL